jgi:hypothetical protein
MEIIRIEIGRQVLCDGCNKDWTDRPESGGVYGLGTKAFCPDCAPQIMADAKRFNELQFIRARCPPEMSFADWVRNVLR